MGFPLNIEETKILSYIASRGRQADITCSDLYQLIYKDDFTKCLEKNGLHDLKEI